MVAAGPLALCSGRRSTQSLQKGLRRAWSPLGPSLFAVAGAVPRASRRDCSARSRRWAPCSPQCLETAEGPAARVVAAGPLALCSGRRSTQSLQKGLRRAWSPLAPRSLQWQAQYPEPPEGTAARVVAAGLPAVLCVTAIRFYAKQCSVQRLQKGLRRAWSPLGPSLSAVAGAGPRASRRDCGARGRRWAPCGSVRYCHWDLQKRCSVQRLQKGLRRAWSPLGPSLSAVAGAVPRASRRDCVVI